MPRSRLTVVAGLLASVIVDSLKDMQLGRLKVEGIDNDFVGQNDDKPRQREDSVSKGFRFRENL